MRQLIMHVTVQ